MTDELFDELFDERFGELFDELFDAFLGKISENVSRKLESFLKLSGKKSADRFRISGRLPNFPQGRLRLGRWCASLAGQWLLPPEEDGKWIYSPELPWTEGYSLATSSALSRMPRTAGITETYQPT